MTTLPKTATEILIRILPVFMEPGTNWEPGLLLRAVYARLRSTPALMTTLRVTQGEGLLLVLLSMILASKGGHPGLESFANHHHTGHHRPSTGCDIPSSFGTTTSMSDDDSAALAAILAKSERFRNGVVMPQDTLTPQELDAIGLAAARDTPHQLTLITS